MQVRRYALGFQGTQLTVPVVRASGEGHCFSIDDEVLEVNIHITPESKHCFRDKYKRKYSDKALGNEHCACHSRCLLTVSLVSPYRLS